MHIDLHFLAAKQTDHLDWSLEKTKVAENA